MIESGVNRYVALTGGFAFFARCYSIHHRCEKTVAHMLSFVCRSSPSLVHLKWARRDRSRIFLVRYEDHLRTPHQSHDRRNPTEVVVSRVMRPRQTMFQILRIPRLHQHRLLSLRLRIGIMFAWQKQRRLRRTPRAICHMEFPSPENKAWLPVRSHRTAVTSMSGVFRQAPK